MDAENPPETTWGCWDDGDVNIQAGVAEFVLQSDAIVEPFVEAHSDHPIGA